MVEKISIQIGLDGGKEVEKQLADIGTTGEKSFDQINKAGEQASQGIAKTGEASKTTAGDFDGLIASADRLTEATNKATEAHSKLSLETVKTSLQIAKYTGEITLNGVEIVQAVRHHDTLIQSLLKVASTVNTGVRAFSLLTPELAAMGTALAAGAVAVGAAVVAFDVLEKAATKAAKSLEELNHSLQMLATESGQSFNSLQDGKALFEQLGLSAKTFESIIRKVGETTKDLSLGDALKKSVDDAEAALVKLRAAQDQLFKSNTTDEVIAAQKTLADAYKNTAEVAANEIGKILAQVKALEAGQKGITFDSLVKAETIIKAVGLSMKETADKGGNSVETLIKFIRAADQATAIKVGAGFGFSAEDVDRIRRGLVSVEEITNRIKTAGPLISPEASASFDRMRTSIQGVDAAWARLQQALASSLFPALAADASATFNDIKAAIFNAAAALVERFNTAASAVSNVFANTRREFETLGAVLVALGRAIALVFTDPLQAVKLLSDAVVEFASKLAGIAWDAISSAAVTAWNAIVTAVGGAGTAITDFIAKIGSITWDVISGLGVAAWNALTGAIQGAIDKLLQFIGLKASAPATGGGTPAPAEGMAGGGLLGGRGSGTSDSNLAWVSRGEYITPASAVAQPGVLAFLEALRRSGGNLSRVLDGMGRFALGGMVPRPAMAFASGGLAGGMSNVTIQFPGLPAISGLRASSEVVDQLHKAAALAQVRSGGRKPSRYS